MKILIVGSRSIKEFDLEKHVPNGTTMIITGGADGVDTLAGIYLLVLLKLSLRYTSLSTLVFC